MPRMESVQKRAFPNVNLNKPQDVPPSPAGLGKGLHQNMLPNLRRNRLWAPPGDKSEPKKEEEEEKEEESTQVDVEQIGKEDKGQQMGESKALELEEEEEGEKEGEDEPPILGSLLSLAKPSDPPEAGMKVGAQPGDDGANIEANSRKLPGYSALSTEEHIKRPMRPESWRQYGIMENENRLLGAGERDTQERDLDEFLRKWKVPNGTEAESMLWKLAPQQRQIIFEEFNYNPDNYRYAAVKTVEDALLRYIQACQKYGFKERARHSDGAEAKRPNYKPLMPLPAVVLPIRMVPFPAVGRKTVDPATNRVGGGPDAAFVTLTDRKQGTKPSLLVSAFSDNQDDRQHEKVDQAIFQKIPEGLDKRDNVDVASSTKQEGEATQGQQAEIEPPEEKAVPAPRWNIEGGTGERCPGFQNVVSAHSSGMCMENEGTLRRENLELRQKLHQMDREMQQIKLELEKTKRAEPVEEDSELSSLEDDGSTGGSRTRSSATPLTTASMARDNDVRAYSMALEAKYRAKWQRKTGVKFDNPKDLLNYLEDNFPKKVPDYKRMRYFAGCGRHEMDSMPDPKNAPEVLELPPGFLRATFAPKPAADEFWPADKGPDLLKDMNSQYMNGSITLPDMRILFKCCVVVQLKGARPGAAASGARAAEASALQEPLEEISTEELVEKIQNELQITLPSNPLRIYKNASNIIPFASSSDVVKFLQSTDFLKTNFNWQKMYGGWAGKTQNNRIWFKNSSQSTLVPSEVQDMLEKKYGKVVLIGGNPSSLDPYHMWAIKYHQYRADTMLSGYAEFFKQEDAEKLMHDARKVETPMEFVDVIEIGGKELMVKRQWKPIPREVRIGTVE